MEHYGHREDIPTWKLTCLTFWGSGTWPLYVPFILYLDAHKRKMEVLFKIHQVLDGVIQSQEERMKHSDNDDGNNKVNQD